MSPAEVTELGADNALVELGAYTIFVKKTPGPPIAQAQDSQEAFLTMSAQTDGQYWSWGSGYAGALANGTELLGLPRRSARRLQEHNCTRTARDGSVSSVVGERPFEQWLAI